MMTATIRNLIPANSHGSREKRNRPQSTPCGDCARRPSRTCRCIRSPCVMCIVVLCVVCCGLLLCCWFCFRCIRCPCWLGSLGPGPLPPPPLGGRRLSSPPAREIGHPAPVPPQALEPWEPWVPWEPPRAPWSPLGAPWAPWSPLGAPWGPWGPGPRGPPAPSVPWANR